MNVELKNFLLMRKFHLYLEERTRKLLEEHNLSLIHYHILMILCFSYNGDCSFKSMEHKLDMAQSTLINIIKRLENQGYIDCYSDVNDKRVKRMHLTEKGRTFCNLSNSEAKEHKCDLFDMLSSEEQQIFFMLLEKICDGLLEDNKGGSM